jgi:hypothetical protein
MDETPTLAELMLHSEQFCLRVEAAAADAAPDAVPSDELRLKIGQCRGILALLQKRFEEDQLALQNVEVRTNFRSLVMSLLWVAFLARGCLNHRTFRMLVMIESSFTYLLIMRR